ncbi:MAG TPA: recombinase family protein [Candidatus Nanoarchaeia archaeon]|nr:recombinase family protein [Candidatus Nanoarchaeia archaeon]
MNELEELKKVNEQLRRELEELKSKLDSKKQGMLKKAQSGNVMSRAAFGYKIQEGRLIPAENKEVVGNIFLDFQNNKISLNKLAKKYGFSINGIKKILTNFTYIGKIKFNGELHQGKHQPLISSMLFNHVQDKLERMGIKRIG